MVEVDDCYFVDYVNDVYCLTNADYFGFEYEHYYFYYYSCDDCWGVGVDVVDCDYVDYYVDDSDELQFLLVLKVFVDDRFVDYIHDYDYKVFADYFVCVIAGYDDDEHLHLNPSHLGLYYHYSYTVVESA